MRHGALLLGQKCKCTRTHGLDRVEVGWRPSCPTNEASVHAYKLAGPEPVHIVEIDVVEVKKPTTVVLSVLWSNGRQGGGQ